MSASNDSGFTRYAAGGHNVVTTKRLPPNAQTEIIVSHPPPLPRNFRSVSERTLQRKWHHDARRRLIVAMIFGIATSIPVGAFWHPAYIPLVGWSVTALVYAALTWFGIWPMDSEQTAIYATREIPGSPTVHLLLQLAAFASLGGIGLLVFQSPTSPLAAAAVTLITVLSSWIVVQTIYTLRYARHYYSHGGGIDFHNDGNPQYSDFAYVATTVGMSYAISDTDVSTKEFRKIALGHALLAYIFGTVFVAALVNILAGLSPN